MKHFLIIGGGIAGTCLALRLLEKGSRVLLIDSGVNHSSRIAAGQINPMVFRRMTKSWRADEFLSFAHLYYSDLQNKSGQSIVIESPIRRLFSHQQERDLWLEKQELPAFEDYLEKINEADNTFDKAKNTYGSGRVKHSYYVDADTYLKTAQQTIHDHPNGEVRIEEMNYSQVDSHTPSYNGQPYDGIVFCEGYRNKHNPFFHRYTINCTKGQLILVDSKTLHASESLNRKCFVLPLGENKFKVGSTYEWDNDTLYSTEEARVLIEENLRSLVDDDFETIGQTVGIRPTTNDRRPIMGEHPEHSGMYIFNGLGTKGYMMAPLLSEEMAEYILHKKPLHPEVVLDRKRS